MSIVNFPLLPQAPLRAAIEIGQANTGNNKSYVEGFDKDSVDLQTLQGPRKICFKNGEPDYITVRRNVPNAVPCFFGKGARWELEKVYFKDLKGSDNPEIDKYLTAGEKTLAKKAADIMKNITNVKPENAAEIMINGTVCSAYYKNNKVHFDREKGVLYYWKVTPAFNANMPEGNSEMVELDKSQYKEFQYRK